MKIGIVQPVIGSIGGNDMVLNEMINALKGHTITVYTFSKAKVDGANVISKVPVRIPFLGIYQKLLMPGFDIDDDVVISATGMDVKTDKLIIYDQNNLGLELSNETPDKYKKGFWKYYYLPYKKMKRGINKNATYVSNSKYSASHLEPYGIKAKVLYPGVPIREFYKKEKDIPICMIGRISPDKNLEYAVSILNDIPVKCVIFGNVTPSNIPYFNKVRRMAKGHIQFMSGDRDDLKEILARSKVYFCASKETFGISTIEAIASGCIPVVPDNSAHPETVPFDELRFGDPRQIIHDALDGRFDDYTFEISKFDVSEFGRRLNELVG